MEDILKIIYDKSVNDKIINTYDIDKIINMIIDNNDLHNYISNTSFCNDQINSLGCFMTNTKEIILYKNTIDIMIKNLEKNIKCISDVEKKIYENLSILQIVLHEIEHANQYKLVEKDNSLETLILRLSFNINESLKDKFYEFCPEERLAEIKSYKEIMSLINIFEKKYSDLYEIIDGELMKRMMNGYHYYNGFLNVPIIDYFNSCNKKDYIFLPNCFDVVNSNYCFEERCMFGFPISESEYTISMRKVLKIYNEKFDNRIILK